MKTLEIADQTVVVSEIAAVGGITYEWSCHSGDGFINWVRAYFRVILKSGKELYACRTEHGCGFAGASEKERTARIAKPLMKALEPEREMILEALKKEPD